MEVKHIWVNDISFISVGNCFKRELCLKCNCYKYYYFILKNGQYIFGSYFMNHATQTIEHQCYGRINCFRCSGHNNPNLGYYTKCNECSIIKNGKYIIR